MSRTPTSAERGDSAFVAKVLEQVLPVEEERRACCALLARCLERAERGTAAAALTLVSNGVFLNVGGVRLFSISQGAVFFCAAGDFVESGDLPAGVEDQYPASRRWVYRALPIESRSYIVESAAVASLPASFTDRALRYVDQAANRWQGRSRWERAHSPGVLAYLEEAGLLPAALDDVEDAGLFGDEVVPEHDLESEGARTARLVNAFERSRKARSLPSDTRYTVPRLRPRPR